MAATSTQRYKHATTLESDISSYRRTQDSGIVKLLRSTHNPSPGLINPRNFDDILAAKLLIFRNTPTPTGRWKGCSNEIWNATRWKKIFRLASS